MTESVETGVGAGEVYVIDENIGYVIAKRLFAKKGKPRPDYLRAGYRISKIFTGGAACTTSVAVMKCDHGSQHCCQCLHKLQSNQAVDCDCDGVPEGRCRPKSGVVRGSHQGFNEDEIAPLRRISGQLSVAQQSIQEKNSIWVLVNGNIRHAVRELATLFGKSCWYFLDVKAGNDHADRVICEVASQLAQQQYRVRIWSNDWNQRRWPQCQVGKDKANIIVSCAQKHDLARGVFGNEDILNQAGAGPAKKLGLDWGRRLSPSEMTSLVKSVVPQLANQRPNGRGPLASLILGAGQPVALGDFCKSAAIRAADIQRSTDLRAALEARFGKLDVDDFATLPRHNPVSRQHQVAPVVP